jgi:hypothetical protein
VYGYADVAAEIERAGQQQQHKTDRQDASDDAQTVKDTISHAIISGDIAFGHCHGNTPW